MLHIYFFIYILESTYQSSMKNILLEFWVGLHWREKGTPLGYQFSSVNMASVSI